ncbi:MAG TPA: hypothetical protein VGJ01_02375 [Pseudolabrys sp.]|jgi:hypothetical protein
MILAAPSRLRRQAIACAAALGLTLAAAGAAQAFTFQDAPGSGNGGQGFTDLDIPKVPNADSRDSRFSSDGGPTYRSGNSTFQFGSQPSFNRRYDPSNLFDPFARDGKY